MALYREEKVYGDRHMGLLPHEPSGPPERGLGDKKNSEALEPQLQRYQRCTQGMFLLLLAS